MSLSRETMMELMALADGELDGEARQRAEKLAAESDEARLLVEAMRGPAMGMWLAEGLEERTAAADGIADAVMGKLDAARRDAGIEGVVRLSDARARRRTGISRGQVAVVGGFLVLAATILLYMRNDREGMEGAAPLASVAPAEIVPSAEVRPAPSASAMAQSAHLQPGAQGVQVDEIDSPAHDVTVFEIPGGGMAAQASGPTPPSVVIMIEDEPPVTP